jgi:hypothetical protein
MAGSVQVRDGVILLATGASMTGITTTRKDLPKSNYELVYEAKRIDGPDFYAAATFPVAESHITFVNGGWGGTVTGLSSLNGADASENETTTGFRYESGTWYRFRIRVTDKAIACWVNEKRVALVPHTERLIGMRPESRLSKPLGFASWKTTGAIRGITMKSLSASEIAETDAALKPDD